MLIAAAGVLLAAVVASGGSERESEHKGATEHEVYAPEGGEEHEGQLAPVSAQDRPQPVTGPNDHHDTSPPLRTLPPKPAHGRKEENEHPIPVPAGSAEADPVVQTEAPAAQAPTLGANFEGIGVQNSAPPDTNGAAGPSAYVQIVNQSFQVFSKTGSSLYGPVPTNTLWTGFGGGCEANDDGDGTVVYDPLANRFIIQQFSVSTTPYLECIAVSTSGDPTGTWNRYSFGGFGTNFPDYPKLGVWPDAYYVTYNLFGNNGNVWSGPEVCAYDRAKMLTGAAATQQCKPVNNLNVGGLLPATVDSSTAPPAGSQNYILAFDTGVLDLWKFHVDWSTPANSMLTGPTSIPVAAFSPACNGGTCVPQKSTKVKLDSLGDRLMNRLVYRNFGDHESLVVSHSVTAGSVVGMRWYELRVSGGSLNVYQQGTYAPADSKYRWMGSTAMDGNGDIALGFSVSNNSTYPGISYTGRLAGDPLGTMTQGETVLRAGTGSQTQNLHRWGDYSSMSIDPADDCTFWYTNEYLASNGSFNWHTRIGSFKLPGCGSSGGGPPMSVSTNAATSIGTTDATLNGSANPNGLATSGFFRWSTSTGTCNGSFGTATAPTTSLGSGTSSQGFSFNLTALSPLTTYYYCAGATNSSGTTYGSVVSFKTAGAPTVTTSAASSVGSTTATLNGSANPNGLSTSAWFRYFTSDPGTCANSGGTQTTVNNIGSGTTAQSLTFNASGLSASTQYWYCAIANNSANTSLGNVVTFTTASAGGPPTSVTTNAATSIGAATATFNGSANPNGLATTAWFRYATSSPGACDDSFGTATSPTSSLGSGSTSQSYTFSLSGLSPSTTYYYCAIASNSAGTVAASNAPANFTTSSSPSSVIVNGGFETGNFNGWSLLGAASPHIVSSGAHSGSYAADVGSTSPFVGQSSLFQTVTIPAGSSSLTFWYQPHCTDTLANDQIRVTIRDAATGNLLATPLNLCSNSGAWTQVSVNTSTWAGVSVVLRFNVFDDGNAATTHALFDDIALG
jgi:hypothetical protein